MGLKYSGPLYFDWDSDSIEETIAPVHRFCDKLVEMGVDMNGLRFYATGGKGFHCEVDPIHFLDRALLKQDGFITLWACRDHSNRLTSYFLDTTQEVLGFHGQL